MIWGAISRMDVADWENMRFNVGGRFDPRLDIMMMQALAEKKGIHFNIMNGEQWDALSSELNNMSGAALHELASDIAIGGSYSAADAAVGRGPVGFHVEEDTRTVFEGVWQEELQTTNFSPITPTGAAALGRIYGITPGAQAAQDVATVAFGAGHMGDTLSRILGPDATEDYQQLSMATEAVNILGDISEQAGARSYSRFDPYAGGYQEFLSNIAENDISLQSILNSMTLNPGSYEDQTRLRNEIAGELYDGKTYTELDTDVKDMIEEWIAANDRSGAPGSGDQDWGGQHDELLTSALEDMNAGAIDYLSNISGTVYNKAMNFMTVGGVLPRRLVERTLARNGIEPSQVDIAGRIKADVLTSEEFGDVSSRDIALYEAWVETHQLISEARGRGDTDTVNELTQQQTTIMDEIGQDRLSEVERTSQEIRRRYGQEGISAELGTAINLAEFSTQTLDIMGRTGLEYGDASTLISAMHRGDRELIESMTFTEGSFAQRFQAGEITGTEAMRGYDVSLPEGTPEGDSMISQGIIDQFNRQTVTVRAEQPLPVNILGFSIFGNNTEEQPVTSGSGSGGQGTS